jgi:CO dehydrogenase/acetyl-CoA synthase alpha subunit
MTSSLEKYGYGALTTAPVTVTIAERELLGTLASLLDMIGGEVPKCSFSRGFKTARALAVAEGLLRGLMAAVVAPEERRRASIAATLASDRKLRDVMACLRFDTRHACF